MPRSTASAASTPDDGEAMVAGVPVPLHACDVEPYRRNPALR